MLPPATSRTTLERPRTKSKWRGYLGLLLLGIAMAYWYGSATDALRYPYTPDSAGYIERARMLLRSGTLPANRLFPPGYPLLISAATYWGANPAGAALALVRAGYALLPMVLAWALSGIVSRRCAIVIAALVALSPGLWYIGSTADADLPFLVLVVTGFGLLQRWAGSFSPAAVLGAGVLLGLADVVRNAGVAAFASVAASLGLTAVFRWIPRERLLTFAGTFAIGAALPLIPLLLWNYLHFGRLQPYSMPASDVGLITNVRVYAQQELFDLLGSESMGRDIAWDYRLLLGSGVTLAALLVAGIRIQWPKLNRQEKFAFALLGGYVAAGASMVVLARTLYQWGESINLRHVAQYSWAVFPIAALLLGWRPGGSPGKRARVAATVVTAALIGGRVLYLAAEYQRNSAMHRALVSTRDPVSAFASLRNEDWVWTRALKRRIADDRKLMYAVQAIPAGAHISSDLADVLRIETGRPVAKLDVDSGADLAGRMGEFVRGDRQSSQVDVLLFPTNSLLESGQWTAVLTHRPIPGYKTVAREPYFLWLRSE